MKKRKSIVIVAILAVVSLASLLILSACTLQEATAAPQMPADNSTTTQLASADTGKSCENCTGDCATCDKKGDCEGTCDKCTGDCADCQEKGGCNCASESSTSGKASHGCSGGCSGDCKDKFWGKDTLPETW